MPANIRDISSYMLKVFSIMDKLTDEQLDSIMSGSGTLQYKCTIPKEKTPVVSGLGQHSEHIMSLDSREEATSYINALKFSKDKLMQLADQLNVNINKSDKKDVIINKIVESVVGLKLRTEAIMTMDLKS